jgi:hypothetical protein
MPSISHRASLGQRALRRAKSGLAALPAGIVRAVIRSGRAWMEVGRDLRQFEKHVAHDVGFQLRPGRRSGSRDPERSAADLPPERGRTPNQTRTQKED